MKNINIQNQSLLVNDNKNIELMDDLELLDMMIDDSKSQKDLYKSGPYWINKLKNSMNEINSYGISNFRGSTNLIGLSYADNNYIDHRNSYTGIWRLLARLITNNYPMSKIYKAQLRWTQSYADQSLFHAQEIINSNPRTRDLINKYTIPYSLLGECLRKVEIDGHEYSIHYLDLLEQHDNIASHINFHNASAIFEIGGGFGTNVHLLLENYKNIRKVLYLDIAPNLYVGTQYLKSFYGDAVFDYRALKDFDSIKFSANNDIEIFCISPWQIEQFESSIDIFMNSHSFVEMPNNIVKNYVDKFNGFPGSENAAIALNTYDGYDINTTLHPDELPKFFKTRKFEYFEVARLLKLPSNHNNLFYMSSGGFSFH